MLRREIVEAHAAALQPEGFKILLDIATTAGPDLRIAEEPYSFRTRFAGESKFDVRIGLEFIGLLLSKLSFGVVTPRFLIFALVGTTGLGVHLLMLKAGLIAARLAFPAAQALATFIAMGNNFVLNNLLTYRDRRLRGAGHAEGLCRLLRDRRGRRARQCGAGRLALFRAPDLVGRGLGRRADGRPCGTTRCRAASSGARGEIAGRLCAARAAWRSPLRR